MINVWQNNIQYMMQRAQEERERREQEEKKRQEENRLRNTYGTLLYSSAEEKILYAISFEIYEDIDKWLSEVKDINYKGLGFGNGSGNKGKTALYLAAGKKDERAVKIVEKLLNKGANPELECTTFGSSYDYPIHNAAANGSEAALKLLLNAGVNPNQSDSEGETALMKAVRASTRDYRSKDVGYNMTTFILRNSKEVNVNYVDEKSNWTAIHYAVIANGFDIRIVGPTPKAVQKCHSLLNLHQR